MRPESVRARLIGPSAAVAGLLVGALASLLGFSALAEPSAAQITPAPAMPKEIVVNLRVIHAERTGKFIDQRVRKIQEKLKKLFNFRSYRLVKKDKVTLPRNVETPVPLPFRKMAVRLAYLGFSESKIQLRVKIGRKQAVSLKLANGGSFLQGITRKNGQNFILAITARAK